MFEVKNRRSIRCQTRLDTVQHVSGEPASDVPDQALQLALEFAVIMAAVGAKSRPALAFPSGLKQFLRFHKLPPTALAQVRAAVEADDEFRRQLASVATAELVDPAGVLWLSQPEGWQQQIAELLPQKRCDDESTIRREERRRAAAESALVRSRADVLGLRADLERDRAAKATLSAETDRLRGDIADLRRRLREAQLAEHATAQALAKAEAELLGARQATIEPTPPPLPFGIDTSAVRDWIDGAVSASTDAVRLLTAALGQLAQVDDQPGPEPERPSRQGRPAPRKPIRLPGGVLAGSIEEAEFVLKKSGVKTLIDGYNVAMLGWPSLDLDHQRDHCIMAVENLAKRWNISMTIVFDGAEIQGAHSRTRRRVRVVYSPAGVSADDVLRAEVNSVDVAKPVVVVTNDRAITTDVADAGANTISSDKFLALLRR